MLGFKAIAIVSTTLLLSHSPLLALDVGDHVVVVRPCNTRVSERSVERMFPGLTLQIGAVNGKWYWVRNSQSGWINSGNVIALDRGVEHFSAAIERNPTDAEAYRARGLILQNLGKSDEALLDLDEAIRLSPRPEIYVSRGNVFKSRGETEKAVGDYDEAIRLDPKLAGAYCNRAKVLHSLGNYEDALRDYDEAIRLEPRSTQALHLRGGTKAAAGDIAGGIKDIKDALEIDPKFALARKSLGDVRFSQKEWDLAIGEYGRAIELQPRNASFHVARGAAWQMAKDYERALQDYERAIELDAGSAVARYNAGEIHRFNGQLEKARGRFEEAVELDGTFTVALNALAWLLSTSPDEKIRNGVKAVAAATQACELSHWERPECLDTLAAAYAETGEFAKAIEQQKKALELAGDKATATMRERLALYQDSKPFRQVD